MLRVLGFMALVSILLIGACGISLTGNSSETNNGIMVVAKSGTIEGKAPPHSSVYLYSSTYDPFTGSYCDSVITDTSGKFTFTTQNGNYNLYCYGTNDLRSVVRISNSLKSADNDTIYDTLLPTGNLQGYSPYKGKNGYVSYLYLLGSPFIAVADSNGYFLLTGIPEGQYTIKRYSFHLDCIQSPEIVSDEFTATIKILSDKTVTTEW